MSQNTSITTTFTNTSPSSTWMSPPEQRKLRSTALSWLKLSVIVGGNVFTIVPSTLQKKLHKKSLSLVMNMAFADMMLGANSLPLYNYLRVGFWPPLWRQDALEPLEIFFPLVWSHFLAGLLNFCSVYILWKILRYAIYWPLKHLTLSTRAYAIVIILISTLAFLVSVFFKLVRDFLPTKTGVYIMTILISIFLLGLCWCNVGTFFGGSFKRKNAPSDAIHQQNRGCQISTPDKHLAFCVCCCCVLVASWHPIILNLTAAHMVSVPVTTFLYLTFLPISTPLFT